VIAIIEINTIMFMTLLLLPSDRN